MGIVSGQSYEQLGLWPVLFNCMIGCYDLSGLSPPLIVASPVTKRLLCQIPGYHLFVASPVTVLVNSAAMSFQLYRWLTSNLNVCWG